MLDEDLEMLVEFVEAGEDDFKIELDEKFAKFKKAIDSFNTTMSRDHVEVGNYIEELASLKKDIKGAELTSVSYNFV